MVLYLIFGFLLLSAVALSLAYAYLLTYVFELDKDELPSDFYYKKIADCYMGLRFFKQVVLNDWEGASCRFVDLMRKVRACFILSVVLGCVSFVFFFNFYRPLS